MVLFFKRTILFLLPLLLLVGMIAFADPFNYYRTKSFIPDEVKRNTSYKFDMPLWKLNGFTRNPLPNIILGDSRTDFLGTEKIEQITHEKCANLAYGGATMPEIIQTFWYATKQTTLKKVYIGMNFNLFNEYKHMDRTNSAKEIMAQPLLYPFNKTVVKAFFYNVYYAMTGGDPKIGAPEMSPDEFWKFQLTKSAENYYGTFKLSQDFINGLRDIASHCKTYNIELRFFIPPTHTDLQKRIDDFGLRTYEQWWKKELMTIAPVVDMDTPNEFTSNRENFKDPYHLKDPTPVIVRVMARDTSLK